MTETTRSQRVGMRLPDGTMVTVTVTAELLARAGRVKAALERGEHPDPHDLAALLADTLEDS